MTRQVTLDEAKDQFPELLEAAKNGETVIIAEDSLPVVQMVPISHPKRQPQFGSAKGLVIFSEDFDAPLSDFDSYTQ